jgi:hypothetical protein
MQSLSQTPSVHRAGGSRAISPASMILVLDRFHIVAMSVECLFVAEMMTTSGIDVVHLNHVSIPEVEPTPRAPSPLSDHE